MLTKKKKKEEEEIEEVHIAAVTRHDGPGIIVPDNMGLDDAINVLIRRRDFEDTNIMISETIECLPYDGANIFRKVVEEIAGSLDLIPKNFMWMKINPTMQSVRTGHKDDDTIQIPWGRMEIPGIDGYLDCGYAIVDNFVVFQIQGQVKRKHESIIKQIADECRSRIKTDSIYKNKAFRIKFRDDDGEVMQHPEISFIDTDTVKEEDLVYSDSVMRKIKTNIFTIIEKPDVVRKMGVPTKRGVLLHGAYGTGKTLAAYVAAKKCVENSHTFLYIKDTKDLPIAIRFARRYGSCTIFAEDIDRVTSGQRDSHMDEILNTIDGVDTKGQELLVVLTSNRVWEINKAMMRPGRLDAIIEVQPPDAPAAAQLVKNYGGKMLSSDVDFTKVGESLNGLIPAVIREAVERAKLHAASLNDSDNVPLITTEALLDAADEIKAQNEFIIDEGLQKSEGTQMGVGDYLQIGIQGALAQAGVVTDANLKKRLSKLSLF